MLARYCISQDANVEEKLIHELESQGFAGPTGSSKQLTYAAIAELSYLEAVIKARHSSTVKLVVIKTGLANYPYQITVKYLKQSSTQKDVWPESSL